MTDQPATDPEDETPTLSKSELEELAELGLTLVPDDHWVYKQPLMFIVDNDQVDDEPKAPPSIREVLDRLGVGRNPVPPDDDVYQSGAWVVLPHEQPVQADQDDDQQED